MITKKNKMKNAYVENILLWIVMFIGFVTFFFFVLNYAKVVRVKDNMDSFSDYGARIISISGTDSTAISNLVTRLNAMSINGMATITTADLSCTSVDDMPPRYQVIFTTQTSNTTNIAAFYSNQLVSRRAVFNESGSSTVSCTLTVTFSQ